MGKVVSVRSSEETQMENKEEMILKEQLIILNNLNSDKRWHHEARSEKSVRPSNER